MDLLEISSERNMTREQAAELLRGLADQLARHNQLEFQQDGKTLRVEVPKEVSVELELEVESDGSSLEIEINW
jgi:amphi-Trp domain-containing protein